MIEDVLEKSLYDKSDATTFAMLPITGYYRGQGSAYDESFDADTLNGAVITAFDSLMNTYGTNYMTKSDLGVCSDEESHVYQYTLQPKIVSTPTATPPKSYPKVLIISAQHGFEKASVYGLYYFVRDLLTKWDENPILDYIRNHVVIKFIPIANPYGFDNKSYLNANGVNLNRNYDTPGFPLDPSAEPGDTNYGGVEAFDQVETQYIRDFVLDNLDATLFIDYHTNGSGAVATYEKMNWVSLVKSTDEYYQKIWYAGISHIANMTSHLAKDYSLSPGTSMCGYVSGTQAGTAVAPYAEVWATNQYIIGLTFEGFNGFPSGTAFAADALKANSEQIGNFIITALNTLAVS